MHIEASDSGLALSQGSFDHADSRCLAQIEYWDASGQIQFTETHADSGWQVEFTGSVNKGSWLATHPQLGLAMSATITQTAIGKLLTVPYEQLKESAFARFKSIRLLPGLGETCEGDGSTLVLPYEEGALCDCQDKTPDEHVLPLFYPLPCYGNMALFGITFGDGDALAAIVDGGRFDCSLAIRTCWGSNKSYGIDPVFSIRDYADDEPLAENISIYYKVLNGQSANVAGIAAFYRQFNRQVRQLTTLAEKIQTNEALSYSAKATSLRCRLGVKPMPVTILEQTPENQPPVNVFMNFDDVSSLVDECARQEIGPTEFNLVGWNFGGHDGAFPQLFPVEPALGGQAALTRLIEQSHAHGYPLSLHDNYFDAYSLAENFDPQTINCNHDGSQTLGGQYGGGQAYQVCPKCAYEKYARTLLPKVAALGIKGAYYTDVLSVAQLCKCYDSNHPLSRRGNAKWWKKILAEIHTHFGVSYSEGARDWALPELDRAYLVSLTTETAFSFIDKKVPLFQMVYHGYLIYNSFRGGVNALPGEEIYLRNIAYGGMPILYYHHIFNPAWSAEDGWDRDLTFEGPEKLRDDVALIKQVTDDVQRYAWLQTCFIEDFIEHSQTLSETVYSNGASIYVNYADHECVTPDGQTVPAKNFLVIPNTSDMDNMPGQNKTLTATT